ncbi:MAG: ribosome maturation factor RimM [Prochlorococcaceae cyanobacterium]
MPEPEAIIGPTENPAPEPAPELLLVGRLVAAQGMQGELRVLPLSDFPERFTRPGRRWLQQRQQPARPVDLLHGRQLPGKTLFVVRLKGIDDRNAAEALVGEELLVPVNQRPKLEPGEFHLLDLVGLQVRLQTSGSSIGLVSDLIHAGNDLLEVELTGSTPPRRVLVPFVEAIVPVVNLEGGWLEISPPDGLLDL